YGIEAERLTGVGDLAGALKRARTAGKPRVIEITVD
ncbi:MAG: acetolactate synthase, partial [Mesorhizobium sp.]